MSLLDLRVAVRRLSKRPAYCAFAVASLAGGVAVATVAFLLVRPLLSPSLGVPQADRIAVLTTPQTGNAGPRWQSAVSLTDWWTMADRLRADRPAASAPFYANVAFAGSAQLGRLEAVSGSYFETLAQRPGRGRLLGAADDDERQRVIVVNRWFWRSALREDATMLEQPIVISGESYRIVGVLDSAFAGIDLNPASPTIGWVPLSTAISSRLVGADPSAPQLTVLVQARGSVSVRQWGQRMSALGAALDVSSPLVDGQRRSSSGRRWSVATLDRVTRSSAATRYLLIGLGMVGVIVLAVSVNLANLTWMRMTSRLHDVSVCRALGASRARVFAGLLAENVIIACLGSAVAWAAVRALLWGLSQSKLLPAHLDASTRLTVWDPVVFGSTVMLPVGALLVFGAWPAFSYARHVKDGLAVGMSVISGRMTTARRLIRWQVAVGVTFVLIAGAVVQMLGDEPKPGVDLDRLAVVELAFPAQWDRPRVMETLRDLLPRAQTWSNVEEIAATAGLPFGLRAPLARLSLPGRRDVQESAVIVASTDRLGAVLGLRVLRGRWPAGTDEEMAVSQQCAETLFGDANAALGQIVDVEIVAASQPSHGTRRVVAVVSNTAAVHVSSQGSVAYIPLVEAQAADVAIVVRSTGDPERALTAVQQALQREAPGVATVRAGTGWQVLAGPYVRLRLVELISLGLAAMAMVLTVVGLCGVLTQSVTLRRKEIALRLALGATPARIRSNVLSAATRWVFEGLLIGELLGTLTRGLLRVVVGANVPMMDGFGTFVAVVTCLSVAALAAYAPALTASAIRPQAVLAAADESI
jgi:predicted permease